MAGDKIIGLKVQLEAAQAAKTVGDLKNVLDEAKQKAGQIGEEFGKNSEEFKQAEQDVTKIVQAFAEFGNVKGELREAQKMLVAMSQAFGENSAEAISAAKAVAELKDQIGDSAALVDNFNPDRKFQSFSNTINAVTGGFSALTGVQSLFNVESDELQKSLVKVQAAMAISDGINNIMEAKDVFRQFGTVIQSTTLFQKANAAATKAAAVIQGLFSKSVDTTSTSFRVLKGAIAATGIGLLLVGISEAISGLQSWASAAEDAAEAQKKLNDSIAKGSRVQLEGELASLERSKQIDVAGAKARMASEEEIFKIEQGFDKQKIESKRKHYAEIKDIEVEGSIIVKQEILKDEVDLEINALNRQAELRKKAADEQKERNEKAAQEAKQRKEEDKRDAEERKQNEQAALNELYKLRNENTLRVLNDKRAEIRFESEAEMQRIQEMKINAATKAALLVELRRKETDLLRILDEEERVRAQEKRVADDAAFFEKVDQDIVRDSELTISRINNQVELTKRTEEESEKRKQIEQAELDFRLQLVNAIGGAIGAIGGLFDKGTAAAKIAALAEIAIGTGTGFINALDIAQRSSKAAGPAAAFAFPIFYATQIAAVLGAAARAKSVLSTVKGGGGGGSFSAPSIPTPSAPLRPQLASTNINQDQLNSLGSVAQPSRTFVLTEDVNSNQQRIAMLNRMARLG